MSRTNWNSATTDLPCVYKWTPSALDVDTPVETYHTITSGLTTLKQLVLLVEGGAVIVDTDGEDEEGSLSVIKITSSFVPSSTTVLSYFRRVEVAVWLRSVRAFHGKEAKGNSVPTVGVGRSEELPAVNGEKATEGGSHDGTGIGGVNSSVIKFPPHA
ncbi:hypothetical protein BT69DRAFT_1301471 [Atractiella rhizophila]|nr:hypothetical protein BT69DRAFT_1301471 [Atractiella rhizophila]